MERQVAYPEQPDENGKAHGGWVDDDKNDDNQVESRYYYPNPSPDDYVVLKKGDCEPVFNADIYSRKEVGEVARKYGQDFVETRGVLLALAKHFGINGYQHREENVATLPGKLSEDELLEALAESVLGVDHDLDSNPSVEREEKLTPEEEKRVDFYMNQLGLSYSDAEQKVLSERRKK